MRALNIILADDKKPEFLKMALTEVARQMETGATSGLVHGLPWSTKDGVGEDGDVTTPNTFTGGYVRHCGKCGMHLETNNPPPS